MARSAATSRSTRSSKTPRKAAAGPSPPRASEKLSDEAYAARLEALQINLVTAQRSWITDGRRIAIVLEGRDAAGKDGLIKAMTANMSARATRVVALPKPSDRDRASWYFQRYVAHLPAAGEVVIFNRSWYNRAGVEPVMGFCSAEEHEAFLATVGEFEDMLAKGGIQLFKYYLDISRAEQKERLEARRADPLKFWKVGPIDEAAMARFDDYTARRDEMFSRTHTQQGPWTVVRANRKKPARLAAIADLLSRSAAPEALGAAAAEELRPDLVFGFDAQALGDGRLER
jgi:polyphosphate kinase 2